MVNITVEEVVKEVGALHMQVGAYQREVERLTKENTDLKAELAKSCVPQTT